MKFSRFGFGSGLMSRDLRGRVDVDSVHRACEKLVNFELLQSGAVRRRSGSLWLADLDEKPAAMQTFHWSNGVVSCVLVFEGHLSVYSSTGHLEFDAVYACNGGRVKMHQVNDLVIITNSMSMPVRLRNVGGVFYLDEIEWSHYPLEGNFNKDFPLMFTGLNFTAAEAWESYERGEYDPEAGSEPYEVESHKRVIYFSWGDYVGKQRLGILVPGVYSYEGIFYWSYRGALNDPAYNVFPAVDVLAGEYIRFTFPGLTGGEIIIEEMVSGVWSQVGLLYGDSKVAVFNRDYDSSYRFKFYKYPLKDGWGVPPTVEVYKLTTITPSTDGDVIKASANGEVFCVGDVLAVNHQVAEERVDFTAADYLNGAVELNLQTGNYVTGQVVYADRSGVRRYWTLIRNWAADADVSSAQDADAYPWYFEPGAEFYRSVISGAFEFQSNNLAKKFLCEVQTSSDGVRWERMFGIDDLSTPDTEVIMTGDNDGVALLMRAVVIEHATDYVLSNAKKCFKRKSFNLINYLRIESLNDAGGGQVTPLNDADMFDVRNSWSWDFFAFRAENGFPVDCVTHAGRLFFGGTSGQPLTIWASCVNDYFNFRTGDNNTSDSMLLTLCTSQQAAITWLASSGPALLVGTTSGEVVVRSIKAEVLSSSTAQAEQHSNNGSYPDGDVLLTTDAIMFLDRSGMRLRRIGYSQDSEFYSARDMTVFSYGVLSGGVRAMVWQRAPEPVAWVVPDHGEFAGCLMGMLYNPDQELASWFCWDLGGQAVALGCTATGNAVDELYAVVMREGGYCLEKMDFALREYDCERRPGYAPVKFTAHLRTTPLDLPDFYGEKGSMPRVSVLMDGVSTVGAWYGCGGRLQPFPSASGDANGWLKLCAVTDGQYRRALELVIAHGHGTILSGAVGVG